jgi:hypothetical protein
MCQKYVDKVFWFFQELNLVLPSKQRGMSEFTLITDFFGLVCETFLEKEGGDDI